MVTNAGWLFSANGVNTILNFAQGVLVARALGVELYGVLGVVMTFVTVINHLTSFRMNEVVVKYVTDSLIQRQNEAAAAVLKASILVDAASSILAFVIMWRLAPLGARWFVKNPAALSLIYGYALVILANSVSESATGVLQAFNQFRQQAALSTLRQAVTLGGVLVAYRSGGGMWGILLAYLVGQFVHSGALVICALGEANRHIGSDWWRAPLGAMAGRRRSMAKFALSTNVSATLSLITKESDLLWLGYFRNAAEVGYYKLAISLASLVMMPVSPLVQTIYPEVTRELALHQWNRVRRLLRKGSLLTAVWVLPASVVLVGAGSFLIPLLYGTEFLPALPALAALLLGVGFAHLFFWSRPALLALGMADYPTRVNVAVAVLKVIAVLAFVPRYGYVGNAVILTGLYFFGVGLSARKVFCTLAERQVATR
jgi:O-antigen/teichoic acid export membrane protein